MLLEFGRPRPEGRHQIITKLGNWLARRFPILLIFFGEPRLGKTLRTGWRDAAYQLALGIPLASQLPN